MGVMHSEWRDRIRHWVRTLKEDLYEPLGEFSWTAFRTMGHLPLEEAEKGPFEPVETGFTWGKTWEYCWFKSSVTLPEEAQGRRIVMNLCPGGESTLFVNGKAFGTFRADWLRNPKHHFVEDNVLSRCAKAGERFDVMMETYAGHYFPGDVTGPVLPGSYTDPETEGARRRLGRCTYGIWDEDAYQLLMDVETLGLLLETLDETSLRAAKIAKALERFTLIVDFEQDRQARDVSYREAREALRPVMEARNGATAPVFYAVGNAHLDLAWLWPMAETHRKTARTFAAQLRLLEEYPEYRFIQSQPASYEMCREYYPELFERVRQAIRDGRWIADGAMWVEPDTNMAGGEALIRQLIHGKRYYKEVLGVDSQVLWLPDTFGYTAALPQILKGCNVNYLVTQKIFWSYNEGDPFPYHYFRWQGIDGTRVTSFLPTSYTYETDPKSVSETWKERRQTQDLEAFLYPFGYGDGGGGPARDYVEMALRQKDLEGAAKVKMASPLEFFQEMDAQGGPVNTYVGELYFSAHRGTYTSQAMVKQNNRRCELALREMEFWSALAGGNGFSYDLAKADALWKRLLLHQFHDILPGSSIARVYVEAEQAFHEILDGAQGMTETALAALTAPEGGSLTIGNSLSFARTALVEVPEGFAGGARTREGEPVRVQKICGALKALVFLPPCGAVSILPAAEAGEPAVPAADAAVCGGEGDLVKVIPCPGGDGFVMENGQVRATVNRQGEVVSFLLKESGREFAAAPMNRFHLYKDVPRAFDAWDIDSNYLEQELDGAFEVQVEPVAEGLEGVLKVTGKISHSAYTQYIRLASEGRRIEFETEIDWKELHRLLKTAFPVDVCAENGINEIQFGFLERPVHRSRPYDRDRFEVCNHRYSALCDGSHGAAVLNDCKYGISMNGNAMELSLLRAAAAPEMRADNRVHRFTYAFTAWEGSFADCDVVRQGLELNVKPVVAPGAVDCFCAVRTDQPDIVLDTVKPAEDGSGDVVLRFYESKKAARTAHVDLGAPLTRPLGPEGWRAYLCDMLENEKEELPVAGGRLTLSFRAFEIKTIRLTHK